MDISFSKCSALLDSTSPPGDLQVLILHRDRSFDPDFLLLLGQLLILPFVLQNHRLPAWLWATVKLQSPSIMASDTIKL